MRTKEWIVPLVAFLLTEVVLIGHHSHVRAADRKSAAAGRIAAELTRLHSSPAFEKDHGELQKRVDQFREILGQAEAELAADRRFWAVARMEQAYLHVQGLNFRMSHPEIQAGGLEALGRASEAFSPRVDEGEAELFGAGFDELPAAYRALAESVFQRVRTTQHAAIAFGNSAGVDTGLYYLGEARAHLDFALFCRTLGTSGLKPPRVPALAELIGALDRELVETFSPTTAADQPTYGPFVQVNVTIKKARELDAQGYDYGAFYTYLDARLRFELFRASGDAVDTETLKRRAADWQQRFQGTVDHSLGQLFWESATSLLADEPSEDDRRRAGIIFDHVLPEYFQHIEEPTA